MLKVEELNKINTYLSYLACGLNNNGLTKEQNNEVMNLGCRCLDMVNELEQINDFTRR